MTLLNYVVVGAQHGIKLTHPQKLMLWEKKYRPILQYGIVPACGKSNKQSKSYVISHS